MREVKGENGVPTGSAPNKPNNLMTLRSTKHTHLHQRVERLSAG
jgi:hypothetical protein